MTSRAHCECKGIDLQINGPTRPVINCHCGQCLRTHGHYAAYTNVAKADLTFLSDTTLTWYRSSDFAQRGFCNRCGASVFWSKDNDDFISVSAGMFINPTGLETSEHIFVDSKSDYYQISDSLPCTDGSGNSQPLNDA